MITKKTETIVSGSSASAVQGTAKNAKSNRVSAFNRVITSSRKLYARQLEQNASVKNRCMERNVPKYYDEPDKFWAEFQNRKEDILDRGTFKARCSKEGLNPENVAEHLLFEGSAVVKRTLETGFEHLKGQHLYYSEPITSRRYRIVKVETAPIVNRGLQIAEHSEGLMPVSSILVEKTA